MTTQIKLTIDTSLANTFKKIAKKLGYLSTQEFIVESARKRAFAIEGLKALQGSLKGQPLKELTEQDYEDMLTDIENGKSSKIFREFNLHKIPDATKIR